MLHPSVEKDLCLKIEVRDQTIRQSTPELQGGPKLLVRNFGGCLRPPHGDFHKTIHIQLILGY